jgi:HAD superfamily hydrolase (TIGR01493 family)
VTIKAALFDFSGTLFHLEPASDWFDGYPLDRAKLIDVLTSPASSGYLTEELRDDWERRDLDPFIHHTVYLTALRAAAPGVPDEVLESIYQRVPAAESWEPYPDTATALRRLAEAEIPVAVISNIPWDIRETFRRNQIDDLVGAYVLSFEEGVMKPDPKIFLTACQRIGARPEQTIMIGDSVFADGGARAVGCQFAAVDRVPPAQRPDALITTLARTIFG